MNMNKQLLDPLGTMCKLIALNFNEISTKMSIQDHVLTLQEPSGYQFLVRLYNGDGRENISELYYVIIRLIKWYLVDDRHENKLNNEIANIDMITENDDNNDDIIGHVCTDMDDDKKNTYVIEDYDDEDEDIVCDRNNHNDTNSSNTNNTHNDNTNSDNTNSDNTNSNNTHSDNTHSDNTHSDNVVALDININNNNNNNKTLPGNIRKNINKGTINQGNANKILNSEEIRKMITYLCNAFRKLQVTYGHGNVVLALQFYINILENGLDGKYDDSRLPQYLLQKELEYDNLLDYSKLKNLWDFTRIQRICKLYESCFNTLKDDGLNSITQDAYIKGYLKSIETILETADRDFQNLIQNSRRG